MSGFDGVGTKNEVTNPGVSNADKDALIRVPSLDAIKYSIERLGFRTSTIPYTDTYSSIQTGVVEGWIGAPPYQHYLGFRDVENYYYAYNSLAEIFDIMMSKSAWDSLTEPQQKVVTEALQQAAAKSIDDAEKEDKEYMKMLQDGGINVTEFTEEELAAFAKDIRDNVWPRFESVLGKEFLDSLKASMN
jgi:TRAP-type C4-dicarboxylate transport system substrate-binding protein